MHSLIGVKLCLLRQLWTYFNATIRALDDVIMIDGEVISDSVAQTRRDCGCNDVLNVDRLVSL